MTVYLLYAVGIGLWAWFAKGWMMKVGGAIPIAIGVNLFISKVLRKGGGKSGY